MDTSERERRESYYESHINAHQQEFEKLSTTINLKTVR